MYIKKAFSLTVITLFAFIHAHSPAMNFHGKSRFKKPSFSKIEKKVHKNGLVDLANLMRMLRLSNPYNSKTIHWKVWDEQAELNVPILILGSLALDQFCIEHKKKSLLFSTRGCCHFFKIFSALFPKYRSTYFHTSRYIYRNPTPEYIEYVRSLYTEDSLIVDERGSGTTCQEFFNKHFHTSANYIALTRSWGEPQHLSCLYSKNIEITNFDCIGSLVSFNKDGPIRIPLEYNPNKHLALRKTYVLNHKKDVFLP